MNIPRFVRALMLAVVTVAAGCATSPDVTNAAATADSAATVSHPPSGTRFPEQVGPIARQKVFHIGDDPRRIAALYVLDDPHMPMEARVVVYPDPPSATGVRSVDALSEAWKALGRAIKRDLSRPVVLADRSVPPPAGVTADDGRYMLIMYSDTDRPRLLLEDALYLYHRGGWNIQYRFTFPAFADPTAPMELLMRRVGVPGAGQTDTAEVGR